MIDVRFDWWLHDQHLPTVAVRLSRNHHVGRPTTRLYQHPRSAAAQPTYGVASAVELPAVEVLIFVPENHPKLDRRNRPRRISDEHMVDLVHADIDRRIEVIDGKKDGLVWRISDLRALPFFILLGEPGIGKSTVLEDEAAHEGRCVIKVRELMTGPPVGQGQTLFLDALDEYRTDGGAADKVHTLAHAMNAAKPSKISS